MDGSTRSAHAARRLAQAPPRGSARAGIFENQDGSTRRFGIGRIPKRLTFIEPITSVTDPTTRTDGANPALGATAFVVHQGNSGPMTPTGGCQDR
jgi:hypothetical protein